MLQGEKVALRAIRRDDLPAICAFNNDVAVELAGGGDPPYPQSLERLQAEFDADAGKGGRNGASFVIETIGKSGGEAHGETGNTVIGHCALFHFDEVAHTCELGITIGDKAYWGKGYGTDAIRLLVDYAFRLRNLRKVWLTVLGNNARAIAAYQKCGFEKEGRLRQQVWSNGGYVDLVYMGILRG